MNPLSWRMRSLVMFWETDWVPTALAALAALAPLAPLARVPVSSIFSPVSRLSDCHHVSSSVHRLVYFWRWILICNKLFFVVVAEEQIPFSVSSDMYFMSQNEMWKLNRQRLVILSVTHQSQSGQGWTPDPIVVFCFQMKQSGGQLVWWLTGEPALSPASQQLLPGSGGRVPGGERLRSAVSWPARRRRWRPQ